MAQQAPTFSPAEQHRVQTSAWIALLGFFFAFCVLVASGWYFGMRYYRNATVPVADTLALRYVNTGVLLQQPDRAVPQEMAPATERPIRCRPIPTDPDACVQFTEGQRLVGRRGAGYGPVAALNLPDGSLINLHTQPTGFNLALERYQVSRWTDELQDVVFQQDAGYARYDLATNQPYKRVNFSVEIGENARVLLAPGGSYGIDVPRTENGDPRGRLVTDDPILFEVAVRSGTAVIESSGQVLELRSNDKVQVALDGSFVEQSKTPYQQAEWQLIPDGDFSHFSTVQYNTKGETTTWSVNSWASEPNIIPGEFSVVRTCPPERAFCAANEQVYYAQFRRDAKDGKQFGTGVVNPVDADVSEYTQSLTFRAWVSIVNQSVKNTGVAGSECPVVIEIKYRLKSPTDGEQFYRKCVFTGEGEYATDPSFTYERVNLGPYYPIEFDLRSVDAPIKDAWYIESVRIEARGQDYYSRVLRVSLSGE